MADIKVGDKVRVTFEGVVTSVDPDIVGVDGYGVPRGAEFEVQAPLRPTGIGAVVRVRLHNGLTATATQIGEDDWYSKHLGWTDWACITHEARVEILAEGVDVPAP